MFLITESVIWSFFSSIKGLCRQNLSSRALAAISNVSPKTVQRAINDTERSLVAFSDEFLEIPSVDEIKSELTTNFAKTVYYTEDSQPILLICDGTYFYIRERFDDKNIFEAILLFFEKF